MVGMMGCSAHTHIVGSGASSGATDQARQWYILFGLVPLNNVDTATMAAGATNYEIKTEQSFLDIVMNIFTGYVTINSRTVTVTK
jgi:hypothetical protein